MKNRVKLGGIGIISVLIAVSAFTGFVHPQKAEATVSSRYWTRLYWGVGFYGTRAYPLEGIYACKKPVSSVYGPLWLVRGRIRQVAAPYADVISYSGYTERIVRNGVVVNSASNNYWFEAPDYQDFTNYWEGRIELYASQLLGDTARLTAVAGYGSGLGSMTVSFTPGNLATCSDGQIY